MKVLVGIPADMQNGGGSRGIRRRFALLQAVLLQAVLLQAVLLGAARPSRSGAGKPSRA